jgi:hypothetical protein
MFRERDSVVQDEEAFLGRAKSAPSARGKLTAKSLVDDAVKAIIDRHATDTKGGGTHIPMAPPDDSVLAMLVKLAKSLKRYIALVSSKAASDGWPIPDSVLESLRAYQTGRPSTPLSAISHVSSVTEITKWMAHMAVWMGFFMPVSDALRSSVHKARKQALPP